MPRKQTIISRETVWERVIYGQPYSKANSRQHATINGRTVFIKSKDALRYLKDFQRQCPTLDPMFEQDVQVEINIYYASRRPDLDESLILDALQGKAYRNDRQVKRKVIEWGLDRENPRAEIRITPLDKPS